LPLAAGRVIGSLADNLAEHLPSLDPGDEDSQAERRAYESLIEQFREVAARLEAAGSEMAGYRDLPMGRHDMDAMSRPEVGEAFARFVRDEEALAGLVTAGVARDRSMLDQMGG
jgi:hypothetical protein